MEAAPSLVLPPSPKGLAYLRPSFHGEQYITTGCFVEGMPRRIENLRACRLLIGDADLCDFAVSRHRDRFGHDPKKAKARLHEMQADLVESMTLDELREEQAEAVFDACVSVLGVPPTYLVSSGYGVHLYYWLDVWCEDAADLEQLRALNRALVKRVNAAAGYELLDPSVHDTGTRLLRPVPSENTKGPEPAPVEVIFESSTRLEAATLPGILQTVEPPPEGVEIVKPYEPKTFLEGPATMPASVEVHLLDTRGKVATLWPVKKGDALGGRVVEDTSAVDFALACRLYELDVPPRDIAAALFVRRKDDFDEREAIRKANRTVNAAIEKSDAPPKDLEGKPVYEASNAVALGRELATWYGDSLWLPLIGFRRYDPSRGVLVEVPDHALEQRAHAFDGCAYRIGKKYGRIALEDGKVKGIARQACIAVADLDHDASEYLEASYVHFRNGVLTPEGRLEPHDIEYRILDEHGRDFDFDPDAHSPALERCLFGIFGDDEDGHEKIAYLQEYLGACLFGVAAKHRIHPFLLGDGENGKSTLIKAAEQLFPPKTRTNVGPQQWATNFGLMPLIHSRFNTVPEVASARLTDTARIKGVLTGDEVTTDVKNKEHITFRPVAGHVFAANTLPSTSDKSPGFFSRFRIVRLNAYFGKGEDQYGRKPTATPDPHLGAQLEHERQGIAAWAVKGYLRFVANGHTYTQPSSAEAELRRWKRSNDLVLAFVDEYLEKLPGREACALPPSQRVSKTALLSAICLYGADEGHRTIPSKETIEQRLAVHGIRTVRTSAARCMSVRLRETCRFLPGVKAP